MSLIRRSSVTSPFQYSGREPHGRLALAQPLRATAADVRCRPGNRSGHGRTIRDDQQVDEHLDVLRREFEAGQGTFLMGLRGESREWDKPAFSRFEQAMRWACEHFQDHDQPDRWMAEL